MEYVIKNREPADVLRYFEEISAIPRGSGNEKAIGEYLLDFAAKQGLEARMDDLYNVVIKKPASPGCEHLDPVILQGHTDMVCEKNKNMEHDFTKDGIKLVVDGDILRADGTTLGADNGSGCGLHDGLPSPEGYEASAAGVCVTLPGGSGPHRRHRLRSL